MDAAGALLAGYKVECLFDIDTEAVEYVRDFSGCPAINVYSNFDDLPVDDLPVTTGFSAGTPCPPYTKFGL